MARRGEVPEAVLSALRAVCLRLPEAYEEPAWLGARWRIRTKTFAHVLRIEDGRPQAYSRVSGVDESAIVLTFRAPEEDVAALAAQGLPFILPGWWPSIVGLILDGSVDEQERTELLTESYCQLAPRKLVRGDG